LLRQGWGTLRLGVRAGEKQIIRCAKDDKKKSTNESDAS
jgi:hypothetical protein